MTHQLQPTRLGAGGMSALHARHQAYLEATISEEIAPCDDMFLRGAPGAMAHYMALGRSAIEILLGAMLATDRDGFATVLDLPCGGGRVTRHLQAFLPESALFASDLADDRQRFVVETFGAQPFSAPADFRGVPSRTFDLIFVGSLVTHFNIDLYTRAVTWFIAALADDGVLILTTHGRRQDYVHRTWHHHLDSAVWDAVCASRDRTGFGFAAYGEDRPGYGLSLTAPSWLVRFVEDEPTTRIVGFQEAGWGDHHDVLVLQKRAVVPR